MTPVDRRARPEALRFADWTAPDGWRLRSFRIEPEGQAPRGSLLFLGGRGDFMEKYLEAIGHWRTAGWSVEGFDWRGQGGSGRLLADPLICHADGFDRLLDDLAAFVADWIARTPGPHVAVAHSMGAHLLTRLVAERRPALDALVLLAPMFGIAARPLPGWLLGPAAAAMVARGKATQPIWRRGRGDRFKGVTSCPERNADKLWWKATHPEIASGAPSWGWLNSALASIRALDHVLREQPVDTPALILASRGDPIIDPRAILSVARRFRSAEVELLPSGGHELLREADSYRLPVMARIDRFLATAATGS